jgi:hypothetical protein
MPNILHRLTIDAPPERVHQLAATREAGRQRRAARDYWSSAPAPFSTTHEEAGR